MARLLLHSEGTDKKEIEINGLVSIGRAFDNLLCIEDKKVSRYQAIIEKHGDGYFLSDLGSINGTTIGEEKIASNRKLKDGDIIVIGGAAKVEFHADESLNAPQVEPATPSTPQTQTPDASLETTVPEYKQTVATSAPPRRSPGLMLAFIALPVLLIAGVGVFIFANSDPKNPNGQGNGQGNIGQIGNQGLDNISGIGTGNQNDSGEISTSNKNSSTISNTSINTTIDSTGTVSLAEVQAMCQQLATKISGRSDYVFDHNFLILVDRLTRDYLDVAVDESVCRNIAVHCNAKNVPIPLALALAMQRSKFRKNANVDSGVGFMMLPKLIAKGYVNNEAELNSPERATEVGVEYLKEVVDKFSFGKEDFAFAIAYYGAELGTVGEGTTKLNELYAEARSRQNFWKIINSRQLPLPAKASENVARFFAAGIVGENPKRFNLSRNPLNPF
jgi:hypothetical protein